MALEETKLCLACEEFCVETTVTRQMTKADTYTLPSRALLLFSLMNVKRMTKLPYRLRAEQAEVVFVSSSSGACLVDGGQGRLISQHQDTESPHH